MAIKLKEKKKFSYTDNLHTEYVCYEEYIRDTDADIDNLPKSDAGSTAMVVESGKIFMVNASGEWKPFGEA